MYPLQVFDIIPINSNTINGILNNYKYPRNKIRNLQLEGNLLRLKKDLYIVSPEISNQKISLELIANHLYGPSYISFESALYYYGMLPDRVHDVKSATTKRKKNYNTPLGNFEYISIPEKYFSTGISQKIIEKRYAFLIACPEKAICDLIISTKGIRFQSIKSIREFLFDDIRLDFSVIKKWDFSVIDSCIKFGYKKAELLFFKKLIENEYSI